MNIKRRFEALDLHRRPLISLRATVEEVSNAVQKGLDASASILEYLRIWASLKK